MQSILIYLNFNIQIKQGTPMLKEEDETTKELQDEDLIMETEDVPKKHKKSKKNKDLDASVD